MKKSLVALAVLAASGASFAQSNVTLYGLADIWLGSVKTTNGVTGNSVSTTRMDSGGVNTSRWGLKGSEDLGGGLKAIFKLEQGFSLDTGAATAGQAFSRQAYVGFAGGFGEVQLGKVWTAFDDVWGVSNAVFDSALSPTHYVFESINYQDRPSNGMRYTSPNFGGFSGAISYSLDEKVAGAAKVSSFNVSYGAGPVTAYLGYQVEDVVNTVALPSDTKYMIVGGSFNFGMATAKANYAQVKNVGNANGFDAKEYQLGVDFPVSSALTVSASYAKSDDSNPGFEQSRKGYGIGATYTLSKRTFLYGGYTANKFSNFRAGDDKADVYAVGVQHNF